MDVVGGWRERVKNTWWPVVTKYSYQVHENAYCGSKVSTMEGKIDIACTQSEGLSLNS
jgi:heme/copper-type cytochrome/quinol oxidase subunit 2